MILFAGLFFLSKAGLAQECIKDSNFYSITYNGFNTNLVIGAELAAQNEIIALSQYSVYGSFVTKFTSQGGVIWSTEYNPNYPQMNWQQYPWYNNTQMQGIITASDSTYYIYGQTYEHGRSINNAEEPPGHWAGLIINIDKFGTVISSKYLGNWFTSYTVNGLAELADGNLVLYLRSLAFPYMSKVLCISKAGDLVWGTPLQANEPYSEVPERNVVIKQLRNGNIIVAGEMLRSIDDTLQQPFQPAVIIPAPLHYFNICQLDSKNGKLIWTRSYQCPPLAQTNMPGNIPEIKTITELQNGSLSLCANMYLPIDNVIYFHQKVFSKRVVNFIINKDGFFSDLISYHPQDGSGSLESVRQIGNQGEQLLLVKDSTNQKLILFQIDNSGKVEWSRSYGNASSTTDSKAVVLEKQNGKGYFIFQGDPRSLTFHLSITNSIGSFPCAQSPVTMVTESLPWPWFVEKVSFARVPLNNDFGLSSFNVIRKPHPLARSVDCQYEFQCCKDVIDSLNPHKIVLCENEIYALPDHTIVKDEGTYYVTLKTQAGCDSIVFYEVKILKSPSHLTASNDTCLDGSSVIQLKATGGYDTYWWNNTTTPDSSYSVSFPGDYWVKVDNMCGTKTDTIHVYDQCVFPIYFPNAFTPNGDFLNDVLKVPGPNKNRLLRLRIFNRWGQLIFDTTKPGDGWDGTLKGVPQPTAQYAYILEMESLSGERLSQKGTVLLIR